MRRMKLCRRLSGVTLILLLMLGCGADPDESTSILDGTQWELVSLNGRDLVNGSRITLNFTDGFVNGFAGCNSYRPMFVESEEDKYKYSATDDGALTIPGFMITEKDCPAIEGVMAQEVAYVEALYAATAYRVSGERLEIQDASGETNLVFVKPE